MSEEKVHLEILLPRCSSSKMQNYWNEVASRMKPFSNAFSTKVYLEQEIEPIKKHLGPKLKGKKLLKLDLWNEAFNTEVLVWAVKKGIKIHALDISSKVVKIAHDKLKKMRLPHRFVVADMRRIPFPSNTFDMVYSMGTIEHVYNTKQVVQEIHRVLKKGGVAITGFPNKHDISFRSQVLDLTNKLGITPYGEELSFTREEINQLFLKNGFEVIDGDGIFIPWFLRYPDMRLYVKFRPLCVLFYLPLQVTRLLAKIKWLRKTNGIITCIVRRK